MVLTLSTRVDLLLVPLVPSILVTIFTLYHLLSSRALRKAINNHVIILLLSYGLIEELTDISWLIHLYRTLTVLSPTPAFCLAWPYLGSTLPVSISILMAWASMERHIIIFYPNLLATKPKRFFFHYLPLAICILWPAIFYLITLIILPCDIPLYYNRKQCSRGTCISRFAWVSLWDSIAHYIMPAFITVIFSVALLARVIYHRYRIRGRIDWRNYKKMAGQLLPIFALYLFLQLPPMIMYAAYSGGLSYSVASDYYSSVLFFAYWTILLTPFASIVSLPDLKTKCRNLFLFWRRRNAVQPVMMEMTRRNVNQTVAVVPVVQ